jgi:3-oxoacyl-[acyl-carrier-protein] synthase I
MNKSRLEVKQGAITNDANHISGPSRTGEELAAAIRLALKRSGISSKDVGFISAHGTATSFNDEMESKALRLNNLSEIPVNSLKGVFGHTLGAAGLIESIMNVMALERGEIPPTRGFRNPVLDPAVCAGAEWLTNKEMKYLLKTASGFGGCNAAIVFCKN